MAAGGTIDRARLFDVMRNRLFKGHLSQGQVDGTNAILDEWDAAHAAEPLEWLAYALATTFHETDFSMQPIREVGAGVGHQYGKTDPQTGQVYYGRGFVQLTWRMNYAKQGLKLGIGLEQHPDLAMEPATAAKILIGGMKDGDFTGLAFDNYFNDKGCDPINARKIVNGLDCCGAISGYYSILLTGLTLLAPAGVPAPVQPEPLPPPEVPDRIGLAGATHAVRQLQLCTAAEVIASVAVGAYLASLVHPDVK